MSTRRSALSLALLWALLATGCYSEPPYFELNTEGKRPYQDYYTDLENQRDEEGKKIPIPDGTLTPTDHQEKLHQIANVLEALFGTPDAPYAFPGTGLDQKKLAMASGPTGQVGVVVRDTDNFVFSGRLIEETGARFAVHDYGTGQITPMNRASAVDVNRQRGLYRQHCVHCHGINGDGAGPTAQYLMPYPRDYRAGVFKFTSTRYGAKATRDDLMRTLLEGVPGTAMPSFRLLPEDELQALVEYVVYLSIRGEVESLITGRVLQLGDDLEDSSVRDSIVEDELLAVAGMWEQAESHVITPDLAQRPPVETPEQLAASIEEGRTLFFSKEAACYTCHGVTATGDGWVPTPPWTGDPEVEWVKEAQLDQWNKPKVQSNGHPKEHWEEMFALPGQQIRPRNLRQGIYRGGNRPVDLFRRVYGGVKGSAMPNLGPALGAEKSTLTEKQIWHVVDYVRSLPYEPASHSGLTESPTVVRPRQ